jgi:hypothetical protein
MTLLGRNLLRQENARHREREQNDKKSSEHLTEPSTPAKRAIKVRSTGDVNARQRAWGCAAAVGRAISRSVTAQQRVLRPARRLTMHAVSGTSETTARWNASPLHAPGAEGKGGARGHRGQEAPGVGRALTTLSDK